MFQAKELAVTACNTIIASFLRTVAIETSDTVLQTHGLTFTQVNGFTQCQHVVLGIVPQLRARIAFRHHVERQTVTHFRCGIRQHAKAVA